MDILLKFLLILALIYIGARGVEDVRKSPEYKNSVAIKSRGWVVIGSSIILMVLIIIA